MERLLTVFSTSVLLENRWKISNWPSIIMRIALLCAISDVVVRRSTHVQDTRWWKCVILLWKPWQAWYGVLHILFITHQNIYIYIYIYICYFWWLRMQIYACPIDTVMMWDTAVQRGSRRKMCHFIMESLDKPGMVYWIFVLSHIRTYMCYFWWLCEQIYACPMDTVTMWDTAVQRGSSEPQLQHTCACETGSEPQLQHTCACETSLYCSIKRCCSEPQLCMRWVDMVVEFLRGTHNAAENT